MVERNVAKFEEMGVEEALGTGAEVLVTGCPFCVLNFEDSAKAMNKENTMVTADIIEVW